MSNSGKAPIRVLLADRSAVERMAISRVLSSRSIRVCGTAANGLAAVDRTRQLHLDVVVLEIDLPIWNGFKALEEIMKQFPRPVIMLNCLTHLVVAVTKRARRLGTFDCLPKGEPGSEFDSLELQHDLASRIEAAAKSRLARGAPNSAFEPSWRETHKQLLDAEQKVVVIGASTGGPTALEHVLVQLRRVSRVQHMPTGFTRPFAERLNGIAPCA
jgi:two-component system chemotaxis response regulator CheB